MAFKDLFEEQLAPLLSPTLITGGIPSTPRETLNKVQSLPVIGPMAQNIEEGWRRRIEAFRQGGIGGLAKSEGTEIQKQLNDPYAMAMAFGEGGPVDYRINPLTKVADFTLNSPEIQRRLMGATSASEVANILAPVRVDPVVKQRYTPVLISARTPQEVSSVVSMMQQDASGFAAQKASMLRTAQELTPMEKSRLSDLRERWASGMYMSPVQEKIFDDLVQKEKAILENIQARRAMSSEQAIINTENKMAATQESSYDFAGESRPTQEKIVSDLKNQGVDESQAGKISTYILSLLGGITAVSPFISRTIDTVNNAPVENKLPEQTESIESKITTSLQGHESRGTPNETNVVNPESGAVGTSQITQSMLDEWKRVAKGDKSTTLEDVKDNVELQRLITQDMVRYFYGKYKSGLVPVQEFDNPESWAAGNWVAGPDWYNELNNKTAPGATETVADYIRAILKRVNESK